jgi:hypothetical protein
MGGYSRGEKGRDDMDEQEEVGEVVVETREVEEVEEASCRLWMGMMGDLERERCRVCRRVIMCESRWHEG